MQNLNISLISNWICTVMSIFFEFSNLFSFSPLYWTGSVCQIFQVFKIV